MLAIGLATTAQAAASVPDPRVLAFDIYRGDTKIGTHTMRFTQEGNRLKVAIDIAIKGKVLFVSFNYLHHNEEVWEGDQLISLSSRTTSNGKSFALAAQRRGDGQLGLTIDGQPSTSPELFTTSYWNPATPQQKALLNTQKGETIPLTIKARTSVLAPTVKGTTIPATAYDMIGPKGFNAVVLYDAKGCFVGLNFKAPRDFARINYTLAHRPDGRGAPDLATNPRLAPCLAS